MTMPSGADGLDPGAWMGEWVTQDTFSGLAGRTQDAISSYYQDQVNGSPSWQAATNTFFQSILGGFGDLGQFLELVVEAITGTPGALTDLQTFLTEQWGTLADSFQWLVDLGVLVDTFFKFLAGSKTQANLDAAWIAVCTDFGVTSPDWTGFWDGILANWVTPTGTFSPSTWSKRLTNDLTILFDVFHLTYQAGSVSDPPGHLGTNGKATWYSAWNDLLALVGIVNNTTAPTVTAPTIGESIQANTASATTAGTNASIAIASNQATNDAIVTATTGTAVTGSSTTDVTTGLSNIPATNIVGAAGAAVAFGAKGAGNMAIGPNGTSLSATETNTIAVGDLGVLAIVSYQAASINGITWSTAVTYGGVAMTQIGAPVISTAASTGASAYIEVWWLAAPASGAKSVVATVTHSGGPSGSIIGLAVESMSYSASKVKSITPNSGGGGTTMSMTQLSATGRMVVGAFAVECLSATTLSAYNQTQRYLQGGTGSAAGWGVVVGDAVGASSLVFSAASSSTITGWVGYTVELSN